jgi:cytochrome c biogenesis protein CcmG/thiol:disulfide interchange protein DsbE
MSPKKGGGLNAKVMIGGLLLVVPMVLVLAKAFQFDPHTVNSPLVDQPAPGFMLQTLDGETVKLGETRGEPVLLNFWATWCEPCKSEHGLLVQAEQRYGDRVRFLSVVYQDEPEKILGFMQRYGDWGTTLVDVEGKVAIAYGVYGVPETFIIDAGGVVRHKFTGPVTPSGLISALEKVL